MRGSKRPAAFGEGSDFAAIIEEEKMKAAIYQVPGGPHSVEEVKIDDPKRTEVRFKITACGVCHSDLLVWSGARAADFKPPMILGHEMAGIVEEVGSEVTMVKPGDHVIRGGSGVCGKCKWCMSGKYFRCVNRGRYTHRTPDEGAPTMWKGKFIGGIGGGPGGFAQAAIVDETALVKIDDELPLDRMALIGCGVTTGLGAALTTAKVPPGATVAVFGAGGVGGSAIQGARIAGARQIIAVDIFDKKLEMAKKFFGATDVINAKKTDPVEAIRELTDGGVEYSFEAIGNKKTQTQTVLCLAPRGTATFVGVGKDGDVLDDLPVYFITSAERIVRGHHLNYSSNALDLSYIVNLYKRGLLNLDDMVSQHGSLADVDKAFHDMETGEIVRTVLLPN
jgi:S-(hydroxymethyl)glutathione dehydrogenase / alcohol dehydrogenase